MHAVLGRVGRTAPCGALVEQHPKMTLEVEVRTSAGRASRPRSTVQVHHRNSVTVTDQLVEQHVAVTDLEVTGVERFRDLCRHTFESASPILATQQCGVHPALQPLEATSPRRIDRHHFAGGCVCG